MSEPLAHSARYGCGSQTYACHTSAVRSGTLERGGRMLGYYRPGEKGIPAETLLGVLENAAPFHDLGKLDPGFQETLRRNSKSENHIRHEDAGAAWLLQNGAIEAAGLVSAHHRGLVHYRIETDRPRGDEILRTSVFRITADRRTLEATDARLEEYLEAHGRWFGPSLVKATSSAKKLSGLERRLLLSCLVDADHSDTAAHYGNEAALMPPEVRWTERLAALDRYVENLPRPVPATASPKELKRQEIRDRLYQACREAETDSVLRRCDAVVGSGKTTAVMAHLLRVAAERNLRHIFVVVPYTNIIRQTVADLRKAICLEGENPEEIVAEHHHQVDFSDVDIRHLSTLWRSPVIVTTAVQFFETLASNHPSRLRKLHELPGSAVCLDEAHASLPADLWPVCWRWLIKWAKGWNGHLVLASGSLPAFWEIAEFQKITREKALAKLVNLAPDLTEDSEAAEHERVKFRSEESCLSPDELLARVIAAPGPRIVVVNTVQTAAKLAHKMRSGCGGKVIHLSTALTPLHRDAIVGRIRHLLKTEEDWTLIATSLVEAGMNFSFASGFRQRASAASLIQLGGRVNRHSDRKGECEVLDFDLKHDPGFPDNPGLARSKEALSRIFECGLLSPDRRANLAKICLAAMKAEFGGNVQGQAGEKVRLEDDENYPEVAKQCRVIQSETATVIIDQNVIERVKRREKVTPLELTRNSVQMYAAKISALALICISEERDLHAWPSGYKYDPYFLGFMAHFVEMKPSDIPSGFLI